MPVGHFIKWIHRFSSTGKIVPGRKNEFFVEWRINKGATLAQLYLSRIKH